MTAAMANVYTAFGLTPTEIQFIQSAEMKRDYFYTSPLGRRMFQLDLVKGSITLALIGSPEHELLDNLVKEKGLGFPLCRDILDASGVDYGRFMKHGAPVEAAPDLQAVKAVIPAFTPPAVPEAPGAAPPAPAAVIVEPSIILEEVISIMGRRKKGEGSAAELLAKKLGVSSSTIYQAKAVLKNASPELIERLKKGEIGFKKAYESLKLKQAG
jgi:hypothetical protein